MRKTVVLPTWRESPSDELDEPNSAHAVITDHDRRLGVVDEQRRVVFSGGSSSRATWASKSGLFWRDAAKRCPTSAGA